MFRPLRPALERFFGVQTYRTFLQERVSQTASKGSQREGLKLESVLKFGELEAWKVEQIQEASFKATKNSQQLERLFSFFKRLSPDPVMLATKDAGQRWQYVI